MVQRQNINKLYCYQLALLCPDNLSSVTRQKTCLLLAVASGLEMARQEKDEKNKVNQLGLLNTGHCLSITVC